MRALFFSLSSFNNSKISLISGITATGTLLCVQGIVQPFKSKYKNIQESLVLLNLLLVHVFAVNRDFNNSKGVVVESLILMVLLYFIFVIIFTSVNTFCDHKMHHIRSMFSVILTVLSIRKEKKKSFQLNKQVISSEIPIVSFNYKEFREPLVAVTD